MHDLLNFETPLHRDIARLSHTLAAVDSGDFFGAYTEAEIAAMRTRLQRLRRKLREVGTEEGA